MNASVQSEALDYPVEARIPEKAKRWPFIVLAAGLVALMLAAVVRPVDPGALKSAEEAPILQGD